MRLRFDPDLTTVWMRQVWVGSYVGSGQFGRCWQSLTCPKWFMSAYKRHGSGVSPVRARCEKPSSTAKRAPSGRRRRHTDVAGLGLDLDLAKPGVAVSERPSKSFIDTVAAALGCIVPGVRAEPVMAAAELTLRVKPTRGHKLGTVSLAISS